MAESAGAALLFEIAVSATGDTVWVNGADGSCLGRFSKRFGMDVHRSASEMMAGAGQCLTCTHSRAGPAEWQAFRRALLEHYQVVVPADTITFQN